jgi:hypothetical protein
MNRDKWLKNLASKGAQADVLETIKDSFDDIGVFAVSLSHRLKIVTYA